MFRLLSLLFHHALHSPSQILPGGPRWRLEGEGLAVGLQSGDQVTGEVREMPGVEDISHNGVWLGTPLVNTSLQQHTGLVSEGGVGVKMTMNV